MSDQRLNIGLLKKIREKIITTPVAYDQSVYARREETSPCGTAACIAGWACVLSGAMDTKELRRRERSNPYLFETIASTARWHLGLTEDEAEILFTENPAGMGRRFTEDDDRIGGWPAPFNEQWREGDKPSSEIAVDYLDHIIETGKVIE